VTDPTPGRPVLVIGYGSELRRDDAAGRHAAEQLAPEHAADIADSRLVVFVDASIVDDAVSVRSVVPAWPDWRLTHHLTPAALLGLAQAVGDRIPEGVIVTIPITDAALGLSLSARAAAGVREAVERIVELCAGPARRPDERSRRRTAEG
jgi:Ni,Fe-hydrogenase maturation factor